MRRPVLVVASRNRGKMTELRTLLEAAHLELRGLETIPDAPVVQEDGATYLANALAKASALAHHTNLPALADDSGLEVDALGGAPGVHSARYAGGAASDSDNVRLLLARLRGVATAHRTARFRAVLVVVCPDGSGAFAAGTCEGVIAETPTGTGGFGYDPVFIYPPLARTFAEINADTKNTISHRAQAAARLLPLLQPLFDRRGGAS